jgi:hypothetical protein
VVACESGSGAQPAGLGAAQGKGSSQPLHSHTRFTGDFSRLPVPDSSLTSRASSVQTESDRCKLLGRLKSPFECGKSPRIGNSAALFWHGVCTCVLLIPIRSEPGSYQGYALRKFLQMSVYLPDCRHCDQEA